MAARWAAASCCRPWRLLPASLTPASSTPAGPRWSGRTTSAGAAPVTTPSTSCAATVTSTRTLPPGGRRRRVSTSITAPVLMIRGTSDEQCPPQWARSERNALDRAGVDVRLRWYQDQHAFGRRFTLSMTDVVEFLRRAGPHRRMTPGGRPAWWTPARQASVAGPRIRRRRSRCWESKALSAWSVRYSGMNISALLAAWMPPRAMLATVASHRAADSTRVLQQRPRSATV